MLKRAIKGAQHRLRDRFQRLVLESVLRRAPYDYVSLAYLKAGMEAADFFVENMALAQDLQYKAELLKFAASKANTEGLWLEFGVFQARDIRVLSSYTSGKVYGFDSFEGLPEDWTFFQRKGRFSLDGKLPSVPANVELIKGWFQDTLPEFLENNDGPVSFLHIDSDLYSSANYVLTTLVHHIVPGTIVLFDDFLNYPDWKNGESKAFFEFTERTRLNFEYIGFSSRQQAVAVRFKP
jgi:hypothetical protein